jgi:hypothetical protein
MQPASFAIFLALLATTLAKFADLVTPLCKDTFLMTLVFALTIIILKLAFRYA